MPTNHGAIGVYGGPPVYGALQCYPGLHCVKVMTHGLDQQTYLYGLSQDNTTGYPSSPSMKIAGPGRKQFYWPVQAGARTLSVSVNYTPDNGSGFRPKLYIYANKDVGVNSDIVTEASSGANTWTTIGPVSITAIASGVLLCELRFDFLPQYVQVAHWDYVNGT